MAFLITTSNIPGQTLYVMLRNLITGQVWNTNSNTFENWNLAHWTQYAISLAEQTSSGFYSAVFPAGIPAGTFTIEALYLQAGGSPAPSDASVPPSLASTQGVNILSINGSTLAAINLALSAGTMAVGQVAAGTLTASQISTNLTNPNNNQFLGRVLIFTSGINGAVTGAVAVAITGYNGTTKVISTTLMPNIPAIGDSFIIL